MNYSLTIASSALSLTPGCRRFVSKKIKNNFYHFDVFPPPPLLIMPVKFFLKSNLYKTNTLNTIFNILKKLCKTQKMRYYASLKFF